MPRPEELDRLQSRAPQPQSKDFDNLATAGKYIECVCVSEPFDFGETQRGCPALYDKHGYAYTVGKKVSPGKKTYWRCQRKNHGCKARVHTIDKFIVHRAHTHNHSP